MKIAIDIDGVLYDFVSALRTEVWYQGFRHEDGLPNPSTWDFKEWGLERDIIDKIMLRGVRDSTLFVTGPMVDGASAAIDNIRNLSRTVNMDPDGISIRFITARLMYGMHNPLAVTATGRWLTNEHLFPDELVFVSDSDDKLLYPADVVIDDNPHTETWAQAGALNVLFPTSYNTLPNPGQLRFENGAGVEVWRPMEYEPWRAITLAIRTKVMSQ